jgi:hypothetical protein
MNFKLKFLFPLKSKRLIFNQQKNIASSSPTPSLFLNFVLFPSRLQSFCSNEIK